MHDQPEMPVLECDLKTYLNTIGQYHLLSYEQEIALTRAVAHGREAAARLAADGSIPLPERQRLHRAVADGEYAREQLVNANLRLVVSIAAHVYPPHIRVPGLSVTDVFQEASIGLLYAIDRFDPERGCRFSTYATYWIRQAALRAIANYSRRIRLPVHLHDDVERVKQAMREAETGEEAASLNRIADRVGLKPQRVELLLRWDQLASVVSLHEEGDHGTALLQRIGDSTNSSTEDQACARVLSTAIQQAIQGLDEREQQIIVSRYGLFGMPIETFDVLGERFGISRERVRQIAGNAVRKLRVQLGPYADWLAED